MISREEVETLANLARLELSDAEVASLQQDISGILDYVGQVSAVPLAAGEPAAPAHRNRMRDDAVRTPHDPLAQTEADLRAAFPKEEAGYNVVRKIIQKDE